MNDCIIYQYPLLTSSALIIIKSLHFTYYNAHYTAEQPAGANLFNFW